MSTNKITKKTQDLFHVNVDNTYDKYINFKKNGKLFPIWILNNFKNFILDDINLNDENDPCVLTNNKSNKLYKYQIFISAYLSFRSPYKDILLYHGLGSGKTISAINIYNVLYNTTENITLFLLIKASLHDEPWLKDLKKWLLEEKQMNNINFIHYDAPNASDVFKKALLSSNINKQKLFIIEEAHNFIKNVYSNISKKVGKKALEIYNGIILEKKKNKDVRVVCLSGTPIIDTPFEIALLFNLLRLNIFPNTEDEFNNIFLSENNINPTKKNLFQRRIIGLVSYYAGSTPGHFATKKIIEVRVQMSEHQKYIYDYYDKIEKKKNNSINKSLSSSMYRSYTRQICNFAFPFISDTINGLNRPRPKSFKIDDLQINLINKGKINKIDKNIKQYIAATQKYIDALDNFFIESNEKDIKNKHTIHDDIEIFISQYKSNFDDFLTFSQHSLLFKNMFNSSHKMTRIIFTIFISPGPVMVYSNYVLMEGLEIFKIYLKNVKFTFYTENSNSKYKYVEFIGKNPSKIGLNLPDRKTMLSYFNAKTNKYGDDIKLILISPAGSEGITLNNVRQVHIMEPYWHDVRTEQIIGRAIRDCSHRDIPINERHVDVYKYISIYDSNIVTADQYIHDLAKNKNIMVSSFIDLLQEISIDCVLNKNHNKLTNKNCNCFQFEEQTFFNINPEPSYIENIYDDMKNDNGTNCVLSYTAKIKAIKILAIIRNDNNSKPQYYWYNNNTGVVYDFDIHYPIGKISKINGVPNKLNNDTYIIDDIIKIPHLY